MANSEKLAKRSPQKRSVWTSMMPASMMPVGRPKNDAVDEPAAAAELPQGQEDDDARPRRTSSRSFSRNRPSRDLGGRRGWLWMATLNAVPLAGRDDVGRRVPVRPMVEAVQPAGRTIRPRSLPRVDGRVGEDPRAATAIAPFDTPVVHTERRGVGGWRSLWSECRQCQTFRVHSGPARSGATWRWRSLEEDDTTMAKRTRTLALLAAAAIAFAACSGGGGATTAPEPTAASSGSAAPVEPTVAGRPADARRRPTSRSA